MDTLQDRFGRRFPYLRLSVTDICNFRCSYCLPDGYKKTACGSSFLRVDEIRRLVTAFTEMGTWKVRLTGGEPTIRPDFLEIAKTVSAVRGIEKTAFTTNGYHLPDRAADYFKAGLRAVNISIDSLKPDQFKIITGHDRLPEVLEGVEACAAAGFSAVKINTVLLKGLNDAELDDFIDFVADKNLSLRFIELMRTNDNAAYFKAHHLSGTVVTERLLARGWRQKERQDGAGPALEFAHPDCLGTVGLIAPYSRDFCTSCNRLRVSAKGALHLCLFGQGGCDIRPLLQHDDQREELQDRVAALLGGKRVSHFLQDGNSGATPHLASIGG